MDASAEQIVLDYLSELADAAQRKLRPDERLTFMARSRASIARQIGETRVAEATDVRRMLGLFGDPEKLAAQERQRLDMTAPAGQLASVTGQPGESPAADTLDQAAAPSKQRPAAVPLTTRPFTLPTSHRPITARWRPGGSGQRMPWDQAAPDLLEPGRDAPERLPWNRASLPRPAPASPLGLPVWWSQPSDSQPEDDDDDPLDGLPGAGVDIRPGWPASVLALARSHPLEVAAILLIAAGVLVYPFPLWVFGLLIVLVSRLWDIKDKIALLAVPVAVMLLGGVLLAGLTAKSGTLAGYAHAVRIDGWNLIRVGVLLSAAYLGWRVRQGRRPHRMPPWYRTPHA
jgi:hypothetical protein